MALDFTITDQVFNSLDLAGQGFALNFASGDGLTLTYSVLVGMWGLELVACLFIMLSDDGRAALSRAIQSTIFMLFVGGLIFQWSTIVVPAPVAIADELVGVASGGNSSLGLAQSLTVQFGDAIGHLIGTLFPSQQPIPNPDPSADPSAAGASKSLWEQLGGWWDTDPISSVFVGIADGIAASALSMVVVGLMIVAFAITWMSLLTVNLLIYIGLCLGPLLLALSVQKQLRQLSTNLLSFILGLIFVKPILAILISLTLLILQIINNIAATQPSSETPLALILVFVSMLLVCIIALIKTAPGIAKELVGGIGAAISGGGSTIIQAATQRINPPKPPSPGAAAKVATAPAIPKITR